MFLQFFGCNQSGEAIFIDFKNHDDLQNINFILRLKDGTYLTIPGTRDKVYSPRYVHSTTTVFKLNAGLFY